MEGISFSTMGTPVPETSASCSRRGILAAGNWILDHVKLVDTWPAQDALATISTQSDGNGGGPYNVLKDLAKLQCGFPLAGIGLIGRDADGEKILQDCDAHVIDRSAVQQTDAAPTSYTDVMTVMGTGRRTFFHQHGANARLDLDHFDLRKTSVRIFYLGYMCLLRRLDVIGGDGRTPASLLFEQAQGLGLTTMADLVSSETSDFARVINPSLPYLDYLFLNEYELGRLVGGSTSKAPAQLEAQARALLERGVRQALIVHLPEMALCVRRGQPALLQASVRVRREMIAGTVGAGDAFAAGFIFGLHEGWELQRCLELGVCVAAASLRDATCSAAIEPWAACLELGRKLGFETVLKA